MTWRPGLSDGQIVYMYICFIVSLYIASTLAHIELTAHGFVSCIANLYVLVIFVNSNIGYHKNHNSNNDTLFPPSVFLP